MMKKLLLFSSIFLFSCVTPTIHNDLVKQNEYNKNRANEKDLKNLFPKKYWNKLHLQIIWYGREYCKARDCFGITCKICKSCYPNRKKPIKTKKA